MGKNIFKAVLSTAKAHVVSTAESIKEESTRVAKDDYEVKLKLFKPSIKKMMADLKTWNEQRKEENRLSREELKNIVRETLAQTKQAICDPASIKPEEDEELNALLLNFEDELEDDLNLDDLEGFGNEATEFNSENLPVVEVIQPTNEELGLFTYGILTSLTSSNSFVSYLTNNSDQIKEILMLDDSEENHIEEVIDNSNIVLAQDIADREYDAEEVRDIDEEIEEATVDHNLELSMAEPEAIAGVESEGTDFYTQLINKTEETLRMYQRNPIFAMSMDRVMGMLDRSIKAYCSTLSESCGLELLTLNPIIGQIVMNMEYNILDAVSLLAIFSLFSSTANPAEAELTDLAYGLLNNINSVTDEVSPDIE